MKSVGVFPVLERVDLQGDAVLRLGHAVTAVQVSANSRGVGVEAHEDRVKVPLVVAEVHLGRLAHGRAVSRQAIDQTLGPGHLGGDATRLHSVEVLEPWGPFDFRNGEPGPLFLQPDLSPGGGTGASQQGGGGEKGQGRTKVLLQVGNLHRPSKPPAVSRRRGRYAVRENRTICFLLFHASLSRFRTRFSSFDVVSGLVLKKFFTSGAAFIK